MLNAAHMKIHDEFMHVFCNIRPPEMLARLIGCPVCLCSGLGGSGAGGCGCYGGETPSQRPGLGEELQSSQSQRKRVRAAAQVSVCDLMYCVFESMCCI